MSQACSVTITFDDLQILVRELHVEGLNGAEVQEVTSKLLGQILPQVEAIAVLSRMRKVIETDDTVEIKSREEILTRLEELKQLLEVKEPKWKNAREILAFVADVASLAPFIGYLQQLLPLLRL